MNAHVSPGEFLGGPDIIEPGTFHGTVCPRPEGDRDDSVTGGADDDVAPAEHES